MAVSFQYNKTSLNELGKQLKLRKSALPTLKNKEAALRLEVRKAKAKSEELTRQLQKALAKYEYISPLWMEFDPELVAIKDIDLKTVKIAGVKTPVLEKIHFDIKEFNAFAKPLWFTAAIEIIKELAWLGLESEIYIQKSKLFDYQRKKTTQKVNLYEKVQIPGYQEGIRKIKAYLEDEENLSKAACKIVKTRQEEEEMEELSND